MHCFCNIKHNKVGKLSCTQMLMSPSQISQPIIIQLLGCYWRNLVVNKNHLVIC